MSSPVTLPPYPDDRVRALEDFAGLGRELEDYADFEAILLEAERDGVVDEPAASETAALAGEANPLRDGVIAERLWLLGYLPFWDILATSEHEGERDAALSALAAFQADAGLEPDRWAGPKTWAALQQLVTFETPTASYAWFVDGAPMPALVRSVRLRLWALGFLDEQPGPGEDSERIPELALARFIHMLKRFKVLPFDGTLPPLPEQIELLFDQDRILAAVGHEGASARRGNGRLEFRYVAEAHERRRETDPQVGHFLARLARIELWLLGFEVSIDSTALHPVFGFEQDSERDPRLTAELDTFWTLLGRPARHLRRHITPELFRSMADPEVVVRAGARETWTEPDYSRRVTADLTTPETIEAAWRDARGLGMRLWDGVKRVWRWIVKGVRTVVEVGRNLARAFLVFASKSYQIVRRAIRAVVRATAEYARHEIDGGGTTRLLVHADGDLLALVDAADPVDGPERAIRSLDRFGAAFLLACRILATVLRAVRGAVAAAGLNILGWARLLWVLVECYRDIRPAYLALRALPGGAFA